MSEDKVTIENETLQLQYEKAAELMNSESLQDVLQARELFKELGDYRDSNEYASRCSEKIASIRAGKLMDKYSEGEHAPAQSTIEPPVMSKKAVPETIPEPAATAVPAPAKKGKAGLIIAAVILVAAVFAGGLAMGGFFNKDKGGAPVETAPSAEDNTGYETQNESEYTPIDISPEFEEANILKIEELKTGIDKDITEDAYTAEYKITNTSSEVIWTFDINVLFKDKDGNQLYEDSRYYSGKLDPGKYTYIYTSAYEVDPDEIKSVEVKSYSYHYGFNKYDIDLQNKTLDFEQEDSNWYSNADFGKADILGIDIKDKGIDEFDSYSTEVNVTNNGKGDIKEFTVDIEYYDKDGNPLYKDSRFSDSLLKSGKSIRLGSNCYDYGYIKAKDVKSFAIVEYQYYLTENDSNGYSNYTLNTVTKTAYGDNE